MERREISRISSFDALRGIMCIGIALLHLIPCFFDAGAPEYRASLYLAYFTDIFFVMGGFFLGRRWIGGRLEGTTARDFLVHRLSRLYPLHLATLAFYLLMGSLVWLGVVQSDDPERYDTTSILPNLTLTHSFGLGHRFAFNGASWAVSAVFFCDLLAAALLSAQLIGRRSLVIIFVLSTIVAMAGAMLLGEDITRLQYAEFGVLRAMPSFLFGLLLAISGLYVRSRALAGGLLMTALFLAFAIGGPLTGLARLALVYFFVTAVLAAETAQLWTPLSWRPLQRLGSFSYGVYLMHGVVITLVVSLLLKRILGVDPLALGADRPLLAHLLVAACVLCSFLAAWISLRTVERFGGQWIRAALLSRPSAPRLQNNRAPEPAIAQSDFA
ncbi:acyltransferase [Sphingomonas sp. BN140010]|uniref:Acyltransferase n=1 Tax=Sphingomonas arvum TaxID=2992113 RepID=A0ABT3JD93_9SPHN|nr:acyltransferase [Sphingomonas sp. BN140010]MCW3797042.1 acyltransferase [Sphingomonas sp. BN140010]